MRGFLIIAALLFITSCGPKRPFINSVNTLDHTTVDRKVRVRDTVVTLPFYKIDLSVPASDLTDKPISKSNGRATVELFKRNDRIFASAKCDSLELQLQLRDSIISTYRVRSSEEIRTLPPVQIKYTPWYIKSLAWIGAIVLLVLGIKFLIKFYNPFKI